mgnify:CR=1 FL=1
MLELMMRKDKKQVIGEEISDESIKLFLAVEPADATPPSLHKLVKAYRGLRIDDFERFIGFFVAAGYDLNAKDAQGNDFIALIQDQRFADNPLVTGAPAIRLYAGVPLHSVEGLPLGTLCIIDDMPRELNQLQLTLLQDLAALAEAEIARSTLTAQNKQLELDKATLEQQRQRLNAFIDSSRLATWEWNVQTGDAIFNTRWSEIIGYELHELMPLSVETWLKLVHPADKARSERLLQRHFDGELPFYELECRMQHKAGHWVWVLTQGKVISFTGQGLPRLMAGTHLDITERKANEEAITEAFSLLQRVCRNAGIDVASSATAKNTTEN